MRQLEKRITVPVIIFTLGLFTLISTADAKQTFDPTELDVEGKRAYYVSEKKRLPVYNFGLGKRFPKYDFGLGKRSEIDDDDKEIGDYDDYHYGDVEGDTMFPEEELYLDDDMQSMDKRQQLYSFGLGKRLPKYGFGLGKRSGRYDFGLGKRSQQRFNFGLGKRERLFNFGLGKRNRLYSFGLGKRPSDRLPSRFNFGLGKRSFDFEPQNIDKREVTPNELEQINDENNSAETDSVHPISTKVDNQNETVVIDSHEIMGHSDRSHSTIAKRSLGYDSRLGKRVNYRPLLVPLNNNGLDKRANDQSMNKEIIDSNPNYNDNDKRASYRYELDREFNRQFRRPMYDFGLGKRSYQP